MLQRRVSTGRGTLKGCMSFSAAFTDSLGLVVLFTHQTACDASEISHDRLCCLVEKCLHLLFWFYCLCFCLCAIKHQGRPSEITKLSGGCAHCELVVGTFMIKQPLNPHSFLFQSPLSPVFPGWFTVFNLTQTCSVNKWDAIERAHTVSLRAALCATGFLFWKTFVWFLAFCYVWWL